MIRRFGYIRVSSKDQHEGRQLAVMKDLEIEDRDIFIDNIAKYVCSNNNENKVFSVAYEILEGCAQYRYSAADYLEEIDKVDL
jgi:hypothetical protein